MITSRRESAAPLQPTGAVGRFAEVPLAMTAADKFTLKTIVLVMAIWALLPAFIFHGLPLDIVESGLWGREWLIGSHKHPALPAWCLEIARYLSGGTLGWAAFLVSALFNGASLGLTYILVRTLIGEETAVLGTLTLATVEHFSWRSPEFNHDVAQIPFWVAVPLVAWLAVECGRPGWWLLLGCVGGIGLYAKLSHAVILLVTAGWLLWDAKARARLATPGPWLALAAFLVLCVPLARWLVATDFSAVHFAQERGRAARSLAEVMATLVLVVSPAVLIVLAARHLPLPSDRPQPNSPDARARLALAIFTISPFLLGILLSKAFASSIRQDWMSPMLCLLPAFAIDRVIPRERLAGAYERGKRVGLALIIAIAVTYAAAVRVDEHLKRSQILRVNWPQEEIARKFGAIWEEETRRPLRIVAGHHWIAGLVGLNHKDQPSIMLNGDPNLSPWVSLERVGREGALIVWEDRYRPAPALLALVGDRPVRAATFTMGVGEGARPVTINFVILPPAGG